MKAYFTLVPNERHGEWLGAPAESESCPICYSLVEEEAVNIPWYAHKTVKMTETEAIVALLEGKRLS